MPPSETVIWSRLLQPDSGSLTPEAARAFLRLDFTREDRDRLHELSTGAQEGSLTPGEEAELDIYCRVGRLLDLMRSKARRSLSAAGVAA